MHAGEGGRRVSQRSAELAVAMLLVAVGAVVMWDSRRIGAGWAAEGPQAGYFPFYVGLLILGSSLVTLVRAAVGGASGTFVTPTRAKPVLAVLLPSIVYVALIPSLGIYVASALFIAFFMWAVGGYRNRTGPAVAIAVPVLAFLMFEVWFLVPLPKGPLEALLGY